MGGAKIYAFDDGLVKLERPSRGPLANARQGQPQGQRGWEESQILERSPNRKRVCTVLRDDGRQGSQPVPTYCHVWAVSSVRS